MTSWSELPWWKRVLLIPFVVIVFPISFAAILVILGPVVVWHTVVWCLLWIRFKLTGIPIPPKGSVEAEMPKGSA
jgi:hypothetical protein